MPTPIEELLGTWREAERLLETLPPIHRDHETVRLEVARLREQYQTLAARTDASFEILVGARVTVAGARAVLDGVRRRQADRQLAPPFRKHAPKVDPKVVAGRRTVRDELIRGGMQADLAEAWCQAWDDEATRSLVKRVAPSYWERGADWIKQQRRLGATPD